MSRKNIYQEAKREHAGLLRLEGLSLREIAERLGGSREQARILIFQFGRKLEWASRHTRFYFIDSPGRTLRANYLLFSFGPSERERRDAKWNVKFAVERAKGGDELAKQWLADLLAWEP